MPSLLEQLNQDFAQVCKAGMRGLVQIRTGERGIGAGAIWHPNGLVVTNAHVVQSFEPVNSTPLSVVLPDKRQVPAQILGIDTATDLAALHVDAKNLPALSLGDSRRLRPGDLVTALGFPWGVHGGATTGIVIGTGADLPELSSTRRQWIVASLRLRPGHSGGPMLDSCGRLVGINTLMTGPNVGAAIPLHVAVTFLKSLLRRETKEDETPAIHV